MIKVTSKIIILGVQDKIEEGDRECTSIIPQSNGKIPVWFDKHQGYDKVEKKPKYWYPIYMLPEELNII